MSKTDALVTRLISKCSEKGYKIKEVAKSVGISLDKVSEWGKGVTAPTKEELTLICDKINYPVQNLLPYLAVDEDNKKADNERAFEPTESPEQIEPENVPANPENITEAAKEPEVSEGIEFMPPPEVSKDFQKQKEENGSTEVKKERKKRDPAPKKSKVKTASTISDATAILVREILGLKKSDNITEATVQEAYKKLHADTKSSMVTMMTLHTELIKANNKPAYADDVLALVELAKNASKEGIELASQILRKFTK